jgi:GxxExxY protein
LACLEYELTEAQIRIERHRAVPLVYKGVRIDCGFRADIVVEGSVLIEIKAQEVIAPIHTRQLQTYLRLGQYPVGLLLNFDAPTTKKARKRIVNNSPIRSARRGRRAQGKAKRRERRGAEIR